ncbi:MAG: hypothetical protein MUF81_11955 [Verrucomicrobia bacterium]|jgi:hypothetical protein|nr:hypothetical protein [Verrucomicrobiota bacterium]
MKWLFKWVFRMILLLAVLIVALILSKDAILRALVERQIRSQTGMDVKIGKFSAGILSPVVNIEKFKLYNPPEFGGTPFLDIPELHVEYDRLALANRKLHITLLRLNVAELNVVKNEAGHTNLASARWKVPSRGAGRRGELQFPVIDVLNLSVGKAHFIDLKHPKHNREYRPNLQNQIFKDVKSADEVNGILFMIWLRSGGGFTHVNRADQIFTLNCSPFLSESAKAASNCGICSRSLRLTTSTGECM